MTKPKFDWKAAYFYLVSLVAMVVFVFAAVSGGQGIMRMAFPNLALNEYDWQQVESFEAYKRDSGRRAPPQPARISEPDTATTETQMSEAELRSAWEEYRSMRVEGERRRGLWNLMESLATVVVVVPIFWWHYRNARRLRPSESADES